jgi:hypothetical protein
LRTRFLFLAAQDRQQGIPLLFGCTFIDDRESLAAEPPVALRGILAPGNNQRRRLSI